jgi:hypothetical protein
VIDFGIDVVESILFMRNVIVNECNEICYGFIACGHLIWYLHLVGYFLLLYVFVFVCFNLYLFLLFI